MGLTTKTFYNYAELQAFIASHIPALYTSSKTSTVIPYEKIEAVLGAENNFVLCDLSQLPKKMELVEGNRLLVGGGVTWSEAKEFLNAHGRSLRTYPTEILATITAGVATSCTGERSFGFGNLRKQITRLKFINHEGKICELKKTDDFQTLLPEAKDLIQKYDQDFKHYEHFKNAPYPRFEQATDLLIGSEGQLGIVTEVELETAPLDNVQYMFMLLPQWEVDDRPHLELHHLVQKFRGKILSCELVDHHSMNFLKEEDRLGKNQDVIFLEILTEAFDDIYHSFLGELKLIKEDCIFEIPKDRFHHIRASVPRRIFEENSRMQVVKMGTDVQVSADKFKDLLAFYREAKKVGISYNLFGHFGDAHLHFNFMPKPDQIDQCQKYFYELYNKVLEWHGSPFAEHGIGFLKRNYIKPFQGDNQKALFKVLTKKFDPHNQFFPQGFMHL